MQTLADFQMPFTGSLLMDGRPVFKFVKTKGFDGILDHVVNSLRIEALRDFVIPVISGAMGSGKSRLGAEICKAAASNPQLEGLTILTAYLPSATALSSAGRSIQNLDDCLRVLSDALIKTLFHGPPDGLVATLPEIKAKLDSEIIYAVVLQIDECSKNVPGVDLLLKACAFAFIQWHLRVVPILTGLKPLNGLAPAEIGSRFYLSYHVAEPLTGSDEIRALVEESFALYLDVPLNKLRQCSLLGNLLNDCGGYPASLPILASEVLNPIRKVAYEHLKKTGNLSRDVAQELYSKILSNLSIRYKESEWGCCIWKKWGSFAHFFRHAQTSLSPCARHRYRNACTWQSSGDCRTPRYLFFTS